MIRILCKAAWGDGRAGGRGSREAVAGPCPYPHGGGSTAAPRPPLPSQLLRQQHEHRKLSGQGVRELT